MILTCALIFMFFTSYFAQDLDTVLQELGIPKKTNIRCNVGQDWTCRHLNHIEKLDQNRCYLDVYYFTIDHPVFKLKGKPNRYSDAISYLLGKRYTEYLQTGVKLEYGCSSDGFCEVKRIDPYAYGTYVKCTYGCLKDPVKYKGVIYQNFCVCQEGRVKNSKLFCDYSIGNDVYYWSRVWTCGIEPRVAMECGVGGQCGIDPKEGIGCWPIEKDKTYRASNSVQYALTMPQGMEGPIYVVAMQNGKVIAKKPISNLSAEEYIAKYGPIRGDQAYAFAQKLGLTSLASAGNASRTSAQSLLSRGYSYRTSSANWNSSAIGTRTRVFTRSWRYNNASVANSYRNWYSYYRTYSYRPTTRYSYYYRPKSTYSYSTYYRTYRPATYTRSYYSRYGYYNRYYRPYGSYNYASSGNRYRRYYYYR